MTDQNKTKDQLISELQELRQQITHLQQTIDKQSIEMVRQPSQILQDMIDAIPASIFAKDVEGRLIVANETAKTLFQAESGNLIGNYEHEFFSPEKAEKIRQTDLEVLATGNLIEYDEEIQLSNDDIAIFHTLKFLLYDEQAEVYGIGSLATDITDSQLTPHTLATGEKRFRGIVEQVSDLITQVDAEGRFTYVNQMARSVFGVPEDECIGLLAFDFIHPDDREVTRQAFMGWLANKESHVSFENRQVNQKTGQIFNMLWNINLYYDEEDHLTAATSIAHDITALKQVEAEQKALQQELIAAQQWSIQELSTPIIPVMDQIIVLPLIGSIDSRRAKDLMRTLLRGISEQRAKIVILDITGVPIIDTGVAGHLDKTIQAARLKGARTIVTGISDAVAETIIDLGVDWSNLETLRDLQTGLTVAFNNLGITLTHQ